MKYQSDEEFMKAYEEGEKYLKDNPEVLEKIGRVNRELDNLTPDGIEEEDVEW